MIIAAFIVLGLLGILLVALVGLIEWMRYQEKIRIEKMYMTYMDKAFDRVMARDLPELTDAVIKEKVAEMPQPEQQYVEYPLEAGM